MDFSHRKVHPINQSTMRLYEIIFLFGLLCISTRTLSQSFIEPFIGFDYSQIKTEPLLKELGIFEIYDSGYSQKSWFYGIRAEHNLSEKFALSLQLNHTMKKINASFSNTAPINGFEFNYFRSSIRLKYSPIKMLYFGIGPTFNYLYKINYILPFSNREEIFLFNKKEYGGMLFTGFTYKNFNLECSYSKGFRFADNAEVYHHFDPINSIRISLGYKIKILGKPR